MSSLDIEDIIILLRVLPICVLQTVLEDNKFPNRTLDIKVKRIDVESKKNSSLIENDKKMFKRAR